MLQQLSAAHFMIPNLQSIFTLVVTKFSDLTNQLQRLFAKNQKQSLSPLQSLLVLGPDKSQEGGIEVLYSQGEHLQNGNDLINFIWPRGAQLSECEQEQTLLNTYYQSFQVRYQDFIIFKWNYQRGSQHHSAYLYALKFKWVYKPARSLFAYYSVVLVSQLSSMESVSSLCRAVLCNLKLCLLTYSSLDQIISFQELVKLSRLDREVLYQPIVLGESHLLKLPPELCVDIGPAAFASQLEASFSRLLVHIVVYFPFNSLLACLQRILLDFKVCLFSPSQARVTQTIQWLKLCLQRCQYLGRVVNICSKEILYGLAHCPMPLLFGCSLPEIQEFYSQELFIIKLDQIQKPSRSRKLFTNEQLKNLAELYGDMKTDLQMQAFLDQLARTVKECNQRGYPEFWLQFRQTLSFKNRMELKVQE